MPYQLTTSTPYQGGSAVDLALVLAPGKVVAVIQVSRTTLQLQQWTCSTGPPALTSVGASLLGDGSVPTAVSITPTDAAVAYHVPGSNLVRLAWLSMAAGSLVPDSESSYTGGRVSIAGFVSTIDVPASSKGPKPTGRDGVVNIGPYGKRVVTAFNSKAKPNNMHLKFWNVPYDTTTLLEEPAGYHSLGMANARRPSIVGLQETVDGIWLQSADAVVAFASGTDQLRLQRYRLETGTGGGLSDVGQTFTADVVQEIAALAIPTGDRFVVLTVVVTAGKLKMIAWKIAATGPPVFWFEQVAGSAKHVEVTRIRNRDFAIGIVDRAGKAFTRFWRLPNLNASAPQCEPLATTGSTSNAKAIRLIHRLGRGNAVGTTFVAALRKDGTFKLQGYRLTDA